MEALLHYREPDEYHLTSLTGRFHGVDLTLEAGLTNASHLLNLRWPERKKASTQGLSTEQFLHAVGKQWDRCTIGSGTAIALKVAGDVALTNSFHAELDLKLASIDSPWLVGTNVALWAKVVPPDKLAQPFQLRWRLRAGHGRTPWGEADALNASGRFDQRLTDAWASAGELNLESAAPSTEWGQADALRMMAEFVPASGEPGQTEIHFSVDAPRLSAPDTKADRAQFEGTVRVATPDWNPLNGRLSGSASSLEVRDTSVERVQFAFQFTNLPTHNLWSPSTNALNAPLDPGRSWRDLWSRIEPVRIQSSLAVTGCAMPRLLIEEAQLGAQWERPWLRIEPLRARMNRGLAEITLALNTTNREAAAVITNTSDIHLLGSILGTNTQRWLRQYGWKQPPWVRAEASLLLPDWSHFTALLSKPRGAVPPPIPWETESLPTLRVRGSVKVGEGDYRGVTFESATLSFQGSNDVWVVPDIVAHRREGVLELAHVSNERTRDYSFTLRSRIDPNAIRPLLPESASEGFNLFSFASPPFITGEVHGRWRAPERMWASGAISVEDFKFRGEDAKRFEAQSVVFSNRLFQARGLRLDREEGRATLGEVWFDLDEKKVRLTNVVSRVAIAPVCRAIGSNVMESMKDYEFASPPFVKLEGVIDTLKARKQNDLKFDVDARDFGWKLFHIPSIQALVRWDNDHLDMKPVSASFYGGSLKGEAHFSFGSNPGTDFTFDLTARSVDLSLLMKDIGSRSNKLEGRLDCDLAITEANTRDKFTWNGRGQGELTNGLIWDIPFFAVVSPALNTLMPGIGNSRARQATGTFEITNGVIVTRDLDIHASAMRMKASGSVDFDKQLNARMEAELLRDMPGIGFLISKVLWPVTKLFEFKITGTLDKPKTDQLYAVPRLLMMPLHPIRTLKDIFRSDDKKKDEEKQPP
ncbi:MAG: AsmA-like C-terminal region-containing protein [Verrucomicrobia bacterium]|nr:AsmA-like C-terminal region-containing protein [Verrucomicrobiota bacterium]